MGENLSEKLVWLLVVAALITAAGVIYYLARPAPGKGSYELALPAEAAMALEGRTRVTSTREGQLIWSLNASGVWFYPGRVEVEEPKAWIPVEEGGTVEVSGRAGEYYQASEDITVKEGVRVLQDRAGRREWILDGDTGSYRRAEEAFYLSRVAGVIYPADGATLEVEGGTGRYDARTQKMKVKENVVCRYAAGITLKTDELEYDVKSGSAYTDSEVELEGNSFLLRGKGFKADLRQRKAVVEKEVHVRMERGLAGKR